MSTPRTARRPFRLRLAFALVALGAGSVQATVYTVGTGSGCTHSSLQAAVTAAQASPPAADTIRVTTATYTAQEVTINTAQELDIIGGYAACNSAEPTAGSRATLDGNGGAARTVMRMTVPTGGIVRLRNLVIRRGDAGATAEGGGIYFEGNGLLQIYDTNITNNVAGYGGGLYARGTGDDATVEFGPKVTVVGNTARRSGGGVYIDQVKFHMTQADSGLYLNEAQGDGGGGYGGGLILLAKARDAYAFLGAGMGNLGVIFNNKAKYGGGVAVTGDGGGATRAEVQVFSAVPGQPARIRDNVASIQGGGLYLVSPGGSNMFSYAWLWNAVLDGNSAPDGAAIYIDGDVNYCPVYFNTDSDIFPAPDGFACPTGQFCGGIVDNVAQTAEGVATDGAVIHMIHNASLRIGSFPVTGVNQRPQRGGMVIEGNRGGRLIHAGDDSEVRLENVLIADNEASQPLIHGGNAFGELTLIDATVTGNVIGNGQPVIQHGDGELTLRRSIFWQPGRTILQCNGCDKTFERVMANERDSLDGGNSTQVVVANPRFIDRARGDYQLRAGSPAVDYVPAIDGNDRDALGRPRDVDLPIKVNGFGVRDIGAFERPTLQPLVLNSDFDLDIRLWTPVDGVVSRDAGMNASGGTGSGSLKVVRSGASPGQATIAARQCIHLPGPARYALNGWGRTLPNGLFVPPLDSTQLRWTLRHAGGEGCDSGPIADSGILDLSSSGWNRPTTPALIEVPVSAWTSQSSLVVELVVIENSSTTPATASGWFDGITLETGFDDTIFADGFD
jgi:hypothetical protein